MSDGERPTSIQPVLTHEKQKPETLAEVIRDKAPDVLDSIPPEQREKLAEVTIKEQKFFMRASPLPDPEELEAYNRIIPNGADRILKMAENQSAHRIKIETLVITSQQRQGFCGQLCAFLIGLAGLGLATFAAVQGQPWFGSIIGGATLVSLVSAFLFGQNAHKRDLSQKKPKE